MGLAVPRDMDGRVLAEAFAEDFTASNPVRSDDAPSLRYMERHELDVSEEDLIKRRLEGLGYAS